MSDLLDITDEQLQQLEYRRRLIEHMTGRRGNTAPGSGAAMLPVVGHGLQGAVEGVVAGALPAVGNIPLTGYPVNAYRALSGLTDFVGIGKLPGDEWTEQNTKERLERARTGFAGGNLRVPNLMGEPETPGQAMGRYIGQEMGGAGPPTPYSLIRGASLPAKVMVGLTMPNMLGLGGTATATGLSAAMGAHALTEMERENGVSSTSDPPGVDQTGTGLPTPPIPPTSTATTTPQTEPNLSPVTDTAWKLPGTNISVGWGIPLVAGLTYAAVRGARPALESFAARMQGESVLQRRARLYGDQPGVAEFNQRAADPAVRSGIFGIDEAPPVGEAPLPNAVNTWGTIGQTKFIDMNTTMNRFAQHIFGEGSDLADTIRARLGKTNNRIMLESEIRNIAATGVDTVTGMQMPRIFRDIGDRIIQLSPDARNRLNYAAHYADELENRNRTGGRAINFADKDTEAMRQFVSDARTDPQLAVIMDQRNLLHDRLIDIASARGYFSADEVTKLKKNHRQFLSSYDELTGRVDNPFTPRSLDEMNGLRGISSDVWQIDLQHFQKFYERLERNDTQRFIINNIRDYQNANPRAPKLINEVANPRAVIGSNSGQAPNAEIITFRDNGVQRYVRVENTAIREALKGTQLRADALLGTISSVYRSGTTGTINTIASAATGTPGFAPVAAARTAGQIATNTVGYKGPLDMLVRKATSERIGMPADPTAYLSTTSQAVRGLGAETAHHIAEALRPNTTSYFGQGIRKIFGDTITDAASIRAQMAWNNSYRKQFIDAGLGHSSGLTSELNSARFRDTQFNNWASTLNNSYKQNLQRVEQYSILQGARPELNSGPQLGGAIPAIQRTKQLIQDMTSAISEAGHQSFFVMNQRNPRFSGEVGRQRTGVDAQGIPLASQPRVPSSSRLAYETANIAGHPGVHGTSPTGYRVDTAIPYFNISKQGLARRFRQFREAPMATTAAYGVFAAMGLLGEMYSAMLAGPEAIAYLQKTLPVSQENEALRVFIPGAPPEQAALIPLEQTMRPDIAAARSMFYDLVGFTGMDPNNPDMNIMKFLSEFHNKPISGTSASRVGEAALSATPTMGMGPIAQAVQMYGPDRQMQLPGMPQGFDTVTGDENGKVIGDVVKLVFGLTGQRMVDAIRASRGAAGKNEDAFSAGWSEFAGSTAARALPGSLFVPGIMQNQRRTPLVNRVRESLDNIKDAAQARSDTIGEGYTSSGANAVAVDIPHKSQLPTDPEMAQIYNAAGQLYSRLQRGPLSDIEQANKYQRTLLEQGQSGVPRRWTHNDVEKNIQRIYRDVAWELQEFNELATSRLGVPFDLRRVDWKKGKEQFQ